jgi:hypothetical protein
MSLLVILVSLISLLDCINSGVTLIFPPVRSQTGLIKTTNINVTPLFIQSNNEISETSITNNDIQDVRALSTVTTRPALKADGTPTSNAALSVPLADIDADDDYGFSSSVTENV